MSTAVAEIVPSLDELAATANREHSLLLQRAGEMVRHAIAAGEALCHVRGQMRHGEWKPWLAANTEISDKTASTYMRLATYRDLISEERSIDRARKLLAHLPDSHHRKRTGEAEWVNDAFSLRDQGMSLHAIADALGVSYGSIQHALQTDAERIQRSLVRRKRAADGVKARHAAKKALARERQFEAAKKAGGGISDVYSRLRLAAQSASSLSETGATPEIRQAATLAYRAVTRAEDEIAKILGTT